MMDRRFLVQPNTQGLDFGKAKRDFEQQLKAEAKKFDPPVEPPAPPTLRTGQPLVAIEPVKIRTKPVLLDVNSLPSDHYVVRVDGTEPLMSFAEMKDIIPIVSDEFNPVDVWSDGYHWNSKWNSPPSWKKEIEQAFFIKTAQWPLTLDEAVDLGRKQGGSIHVANLQQALALMEAIPWLSLPMNLVVLGTSKLSMGTRLVPVLKEASDGRRRLSYNGCSSKFGTDCAFLYSFQLKLR